MTVLVRDKDHGEGFTDMHTSSLLSTLNIIRIKGDIIIIILNRKIIIIILKKIHNINPLYKTCLLPNVECDEKY